MSLKLKITAGYLGLLLLLLGMGAYAFRAMRQLEARSRSALQANFYSIELGQQMLQALDALAGPPPAPTDSAARQRFAQALAREAANVTEPGEQAVVDSLRAALPGLSAGEAAAPARLRALTHRMIRLNTAALLRKNEAANQAVQQAGRYLLAFTALATLIALMFVLSVPESAVGPLRKLTQSLEQAGEQDFSGELVVDNNDEFAGVGRAFNRLLGQLREFRSIQLNPQPLDVAGLVQFAAATVQAQLAPRQLSLRLDLAPDLPPARADVEKTAWVLITLLANASRYAPAGSALTVRAAPVPGSYVQVTVHDEGPGIASAQQARLFERFAQLPDPAQYAGGAGLGLSIAREFLLTQGGRLWVESQPGAGSSFCFTLPVESPVASAAPPNGVSQRENPSG